MSDTIEFLDLADPLGLKQFKELKIDGYNEYCVEPMIFPQNQCEESINLIEPSVIYFFGGIADENKIAKREGCPLN